MKKYQNPQLTVLSFIQSDRIANVPIDDFLTANGYQSSDIAGAVEDSYAINS